MPETAVCEIFKNFPLSGMNTWGSGGRCLWLASPRSASEAAAFVRSGAASETAAYVLGGGSNVLVQDGALNAGIVSCARMSGISLSPADDGGASAEIEAGFPVKKLLALSVEKNLGGLEFLVGSPGTVVGALCGYAGACGVSFAPLVKRIETVSQDGRLRVWEAGELDWSYRASPWAGGAPFMITRAFMRFPTSAKDNIIKNIRHFSSLKKGQPIGAKTAGCVFKNPPGLAAGMLLDRCGCKGLSVGAAAVSARHANFIENMGGASSSEIFRLSELCRKRVFDAFGIELEYEIKFFGAF